MPKRSPSTLDPRSPLVLDTRDLPRRPGALREVQRVVAAPTDLGVELIGVPEGADLNLDLRLQSVSEGVLVSGTITGPVRGECGRCLREINDSMAVTIQELYAYENSTTDATTDEDEVGRMQGDLIDLEPALRDALVLTLPTNPRCREDCPGLCPECGAHWDDLPADHSHQQVDPRWAGLSQLTRTEE
ncbi:YceD family protein [Micromonospora sp. NPDC047467]|uniref:YceD family protein n=1 Tax=Micromonospora sp. NPDC047467 TaxID=3154814 RepID=UPI0033FAD6B7